MRQATALVLAGGKSKRMGTPKMWLDFGGEPLLARIVRIAGSVCGEVLIARAPGFDLPTTPARVIDDLHPGLGPISGIECGLAAASHDAVFVTSCDVPFLAPGVIDVMLDAVRGHESCAARIDGLVQPINAVYTRSLSPLVRELIAADRLRPLFLLERARILEANELHAFTECWRNLNTPDDYQRALAKLTAPPRP